MTEETKTIEGTLETFDSKPFAKDGENKLRYSYKVGGKYYSGFIDPLQMLNKKVRIEFYEKTNPKNKDNPYRNVTVIVAIGEPDVEDLSGETPVPKQQPQATEENPAFFGMVINLAVAETRQLRLHPLSDKAPPPYLDHLDEVFEVLWEFAKTKRKEKLGY